LIKLSNITASLFLPKPSAGLSFFVWLGPYHVHNNCAQTVNYLYVGTPLHSTVEFEFQYLFSGLKLSNSALRQLL